MTGCQNKSLLSQTQPCNARERPDLPAQYFWSQHPLSSCDCDVHKEWGVHVCTDVLTDIVLNEALPIDRRDREWSETTRSSTLSGIGEETRHGRLSKTGCRLLDFLSACQSEGRRHGPTRTPLVTCRLSEEDPSESRWIFGFRTYLLMYAKAINMPHQHNARSFKSCRKLGNAV